MVVKTDVTKQPEFEALLREGAERGGADRYRGEQRLERLPAGQSLHEQRGAGRGPGLDGEREIDLFACKAIAPYFMERKYGKIVNIASIAGPMNSPNMPPYSVSKMGVVTLTKIVAKDMAQHNVNVNAICPESSRLPFWQETAERLIQAGGALAGMKPRESSRTD